MLTVGVELGARRYDVAIGEIDAEPAVAHILAAAGAPSGVALLVDAGLVAASPRVEPLAAAFRARGLQVDRRDLPAGEASKTLAEIERTCEWLAGCGHDRGTLLVGVGGGATGDHAGFAAAVYLRGVAFALCPTTLLAMVDASVGGKTAVNLAAGKNLVGAFHQPRAVVADIAFLTTLPARQRTAGLAEVVKCGLVLDAALLDALEAHARGGGPPLDAVVAKAVLAKAAVVAEDEREAGRRALLNFGHTLGHAFEAESGFALLHGEAVALGMAAALDLGRRRGVTPADVAARALALCAVLGLPVDYRALLTPAVLARVGTDKKRRAGRLRFVLCSGAGQAEIADMSPSELGILVEP